MDSRASSGVLQGQSLRVASEPGSRTSCLTRPCRERDSALRPALLERAPPTGLSPPSPEGGVAMRARV